MLSTEHRARIGKANSGRLYTEEQRMLFSEVAKKRHARERAEGPALSSPIRALALPSTIAVWYDAAIAVCGGVS